MIMRRPDGTVAISPLSMSTLSEVCFVTNTLNVTQPDRSAASSVHVADVVTDVADRTHSFQQTHFRSVRKIMWSILLP